MDVSCETLDARSGRKCTHSGVWIGQEALVCQADEQGGFADGRIAWRNTTHIVSTSRDDKESTYR